jgi:hypothetical protein
VFRNCPILAVLDKHIRIKDLICPSSRHLPVGSRPANTRVDLQDTGTSSDVFVMTIIAFMIGSIWELVAQRFKKSSPY